MPWVYTDEQQSVMDEAGGYGYQYGDLYRKLGNLAGAFASGNDLFKKGPKKGQTGRITGFMEPMNVAADVLKTGAIADYRENRGGAAFAQGGSKLTDAGSARIGRLYDRSKGNAQVSMFNAAKQGVNALYNNQFEEGQNRYLQSLGIQAGVANNPHKESAWWETALDIVGA